MPDSITPDDERFEEIPNPSWQALNRQRDELLAEVERLRALEDEVRQQINAGRLGSGWVASYLPSFPFRLRHV